MNKIGYIVYYEEDGPDGGLNPDRYYTPALAGGWVYVAQALVEKRPDSTVCVKPVYSVPEWA